MKHLFKLIALTAAVVLPLISSPPAARAAQYRYDVIGGLDGTTTNSVEGQQVWSFTGAYTNGITVTGDENLGIMFAYKPKKNESNTVTLHWNVAFDPLYQPQSLSTTNPTQRGVWTIGSGSTTNAAGWVIWTTNMPMSTYGYWIPTALSNNMADTSYISNIVGRAYHKPVASN